MIYRRTGILTLILTVLTVITGIMAGMMLHILVLIKDGGNMVLVMSMITETAVFMTAAISIYFILLMLKMTYRFRVFQKAEVTGTEIKSKMERRDCDIKAGIQKLQQKYTDAEKLHTARNRFVSWMSHDLRTPMNAILGYSMLIEKDSDDRETVKHYAGQILSSGQILLELINDMLDMGCIENGNIKLVENEFSLLSAMEEVQAVIRPQAEAKNQVFTFSITNPSGMDMIVGDKQRLCQILRNVLSNAVKYTSATGRIDMNVEIDEGCADNVQLICRIKDNGCGMSKEFLQQIFKPYEREINEKNAGVAGAGLGMCIARCFTELMNGELTVESEPGAGTLVSVRIPLKTAAEKEKHIAGGFSDGAVLQGLRFLAAEDNELNVEILYEVLGSMGAECTIVEHGQAAVETFEQSEPGWFDVILMDVHMPVMGGYQATEAIRSGHHPDASTVKIVAMTADAFEDDVEKAIASGMDAHVAKPLNLQAFINTIASFDLRRQ